METDTPHWFKSSYSSFATNCVEAAFTGPGRFKSSHSSSEDGGCDEAVLAERPAVLVRDTQNREDSMLGVGAREWAGLVRLLTT